MSKPTPQWPTRADHRFILKLTSLTLGGKIVPLPGEFDRVSRVFSKAGGSWKRVFHGSAEDIDLLKKVLKVAFKHGYLTKKEKWK
jgi:hypothetical protein